MVVAKRDRPLASAQAQSVTTAISSWAERSALFDSIACVSRVQHTWCCGVESLRYMLVPFESLREAERGVRH